MYLYKASNTYFNKSGLFYHQGNISRDLLTFTIFSASNPLQTFKLLDWMHLFSIIMLRTGKEAG